MSRILGLLVGVALSLSTMAAPAVAAPSAGRPLITVGDYRAVVSPNGDGYRDRLRLPFELTETARVEARVTVPDTGRVIRDGCPATAAPDCSYAEGTHVLSWRDLRPASRRWQHPPLGTYQVTLVATTADPVDPERQEVRATFHVIRGGVVIDQPDSDDPSGTRSFSPNGDGRQDRLRVSYRLDQRSRVTAVIQPAASGPTHRVRLGVRSPGHRTWVWGGRVGGRTVADGTYRLTLRAAPVAGGRASAAAQEVVVDTLAPDPSVRLNRPTVYPRATEISDSLRVGLDAPSARVSAEILSTSGRRIVRLAPTPHDCYWGQDYPDEEACTLLTWYAETGSGPVPAGRYRLRIAVRDEVGNRAVRTRAVRVSDAQLVEQTGTASWAASAAPRAQDWCEGNICGEAVPCPPYASERFPEGSSFRSDPEECTSPLPESSASYGFTPDLPAGSTTADRFRITVTGGPTTPGAADTGYLWLSGASGPGTSAEDPRVSLAGDTTIVTDWVAARTDVELFPDRVGGHLDARMRWRAGAPDDDRYDIASYTLDYTYYVPA